MYACPRARARAPHWRARSAHPLRASGATPPLRTLRADRVARAASALPTASASSPRELHRRKGKRARLRRAAASRPPRAGRAAWRQAAPRLICASMYSSSLRSASRRPVGAPTRGKSWPPFGPSPRSRGGARLARARRVSSRNRRLVAGGEHRDGLRAALAASGRPRPRCRAAALRGAGPAGRPRRAPSPDRAAESVSRGKC